MDFQDKPINDVAVESGVIFVVGFIPASIALCFGDVDTFKAIAETLIPSSFLWKYTSILFLISFVVVFLDHLFLKKGNATRITWQYLRAISVQAGGSLLSLLRAITGVLFSCIAAWYVFEPETIAFPLLTNLVLLCATLFLGCIALSKLNHNVAKYRHV